MSATDPVPRTTHALPRLSIAGLMLAFALAATMATVVGVAAWSLGSGGLSSSSSSAAAAAAYQRGLQAGVARSHHQIISLKRSAYTEGRRKGYKKGLRDGIVKGRKVGTSVGHADGYRLGYVAGLAAKQAGTSNSTGAH